MTDQDVPSQVPSMDELVELTAGKGSDRGRAFFENKGRLVPVKGEYAVWRKLEEDGKVFARLFKYVLEGPPYTPAYVPPGGEPRKPTRFEVTAINAIHARDEVISSSAFKPSGYSPGFVVIWSEVEEGAPEHEFAQALTSAYAGYDAMVESCETYEEWERRNSAFYSELSIPQRQALAKVHALANVGMELRLRASRSEHWQSLAPKELTPEEQAKAQAEAVETQKAAAQSLADKFKDLFGGLSDEEKRVLGGMAESAASGPMAAAFQAGHDFSQGIGIDELVAGENAAQQGMFPDGDWVELSGVPAEFQQQAFPGGVPMSQAVQDFAKDFPQGFPQGVPVPPVGPGGVPLGGLFTPDQVVTAESFFQGGPPSPFPTFPGVYGMPGQPFGPHGAVGAFGMPAFTPGAEESFTLGDSEERDGRQLEAATAEADALRARLHADANERYRKLSMFKDTVAGGLHWLLSKVEGPPPPPPEEPVGPVEQIMGRTGVNGSRAGVIEALTAASRTRRFGGRESVAAGPLDVGAPGESF